MENTPAQRDRGKEKGESCAAIVSQDFKVKRYTHRHTHMRVYIHTYIRVYIYTQAYVHIYVHIYVYKTTMVAVSSNLFYFVQIPSSLSFHFLYFLFVLCPLEFKYHHRAGLTSGLTS